MTTPKFPDTWSGSSSVAAVPVLKSDLGGHGTQRFVISIPVKSEFQTAKIRLCAVAIGKKLYGFEGFVRRSVRIQIRLTTDWTRRATFMWKCQGCNWQKSPKVVTESTTYYSATWTFAYDERQWKLEPLNVGYMELIDGGLAGDSYLKPITNPDGDAVTEPVALDAAGRAAFNTKPVVSGRTLGEGWYVYSKADFSYFGTPS